MIRATSFLGGSFTTSAMLSSATTCTSMLMAQAGACFTAAVARPGERSPSSPGGVAIRAAATAWAGAGAATGSGRGVCGGSAAAGGGFTGCGSIRLDMAVSHPTPPGERGLPAGPMLVNYTGFCGRKT